MKAHLIIKFGPGVIQEKFPAWTEVIAHKAAVPERIGHATDAVLERYGIRVWVTQEYKASGSRYRAEEIQQGLDRIYRLIRQEEGDFPENLLSEIAALPGVEYVRQAIIGSAPIPPPAQAMAMTPTDPEASRKAIWLRPAQRYSTGHPAIKVAVLDTGPDARAGLCGPCTSGCANGIRSTCCTSRAGCPASGETGSAFHFAGVFAGPGLD